MNSGHESFHCSPLAVQLQQSCVLWSNETGTKKEKTENLFFFVFVPMLINAKNVTELKSNTYSFENIPDVVLCGNKTSGQLMFFSNHLTQYFHTKTHFPIYLASEQTIQPKTAQTN